MTEQIGNAKVLLWFVMPCVLLLAPFAAGGGEPQEDAYAISFVRYCVATDARGWRSSSKVRRLPTLGDRVGVALIKGLSLTELADPETVRHILPVIREAFSQPSSISTGEDRSADVTLLLLKHLEQNVADANLKAQIQEVSNFVRTQAPPISVASDPR